MIKREKLRPTVLPSGVAFPRVETRHVRRVICAVGISENGAIEGNSSEVPIQSVFVTLYPTNKFEKFVPVLANLVHFSQDPEKMAALKRLAGHKEEFQIVRDEVFPWGVRGFMHSHLASPIHRMHNRT
jgi:mannitol/fructose-specific phosphotransferase system IIA component (Ntr-type)